MEEQKMVEEVAFQHNPGRFQIDSTASFAQGPDFWKSKADVLIINLPEDDLLQGYFFQKLKADVPRTQPLILLCAVISAPLMKLSQQFSRVRMLKTPVVGFNLYKCAIDLLQDYEPGQTQIHPRYATDQPVALKTIDGSAAMKAVMKNLSISGAYLESNDQSFEIKTGDMLKIEVLLGDSKKEYAFDVKVVWLKPLDGETRGFGVTFVETDDIYNSLLKFV
jgi:Tfp pilus assembly protein PilZ